MRKMDTKYDVVTALKRLTTGLLSMIMAFAIVLSATPDAEAANWTDPYMETMIEWGAIREEDAENYGKEITRAELIAMVNRTFGYTEVGPTPFNDVPEDAWYAEDIAIAYTAGYFTGIANGTSEVTASPNDIVTREQAAVILARNLRLQGTTGEIMTFTDGREIGNWSRGLIQEAVRLNIITGYPDGSFKPQKSILLGEMAALLSRAVGSVIQDPGEYANKGVYTNLTISSPGVELKDSVVTGDLYLSGGIGLEDVVLENVTVQGKIVVTGGGRAQEGESSIILRNVVADELIVDSLTNQFLSIRSEGLTNIDTTEVRTSAFIEDLTKNDLGLKNISFDSADGSLLQLAGNVKNVINLTPASTLNIAQGVADVVTVDEKAVGTTVKVDNTAYVKDLNLDTAATVTGTGDVDHLDVSADGSTVEMLPDTLTVRPGTTADINGEEMDTEAAAESSEDPRILTGYPATRDVSPKAAQMVFSTNKKGTLYWAVTAVSDGSVQEADLITPSGYGSKIIKSGSIAVKQADTEVTAKISGLTSGGSYYISAVLEDSRGMCSPVKVTAFTTPDDTTPAFADGYPKTIFSEDANGNIVLQAHVMANKNCRLYYALLPDGSTAPKAADFKAAAVSGNLGFGSEDLLKNTPFLIDQVNTTRLSQETTYDLYFWLTDVDGTKSSAVKKVEVTTPDKTAPKIEYLRLEDSEAKRLKLSFALNEPGVLYWAIVKHGVTFLDGVDLNSLDELNSDVAKMQIETGIGALNKGSAKASKAGKEVTFTISKLEPQTAYDLYFVAKDQAGLYNVYTETLKPPLTLNTKDDVPPTVEQVFDNNNGTDSKPNPYPDTNIDLVFSENVQGYTNDKPQVLHAFYEMYQNTLDMTKTAEERAAAKDALVSALAEHIKLYYYPAGTGSADVVVARTSNDQEDWTIDYRNAVISLDTQSGELIITFPYYDESIEGNKGKSAINLEGGSTYYFVLSNIADTSDNVNVMSGSNKKPGLKLTEFTVVSAQVYFSPGVEADTTGKGFHMTFTVDPVSNESMAGGIWSDLVFWSDTAITFDLYQYVDDPNGDGKTDDGEWKQVNPNDTPASFSYVPGRTLGASKSYISTGSTENEFALLAGMEELKAMESQQYAIEVTSVGGKAVDNLTAEVKIYVTAVSGTSGELFGYTRNLALAVVYDRNVSDGILDLTIPPDFSVSYTFIDKTPPEFVTLEFEPGDTGVNIGLILDRNNSNYYYVVAPLGDVNTEVDGNIGALTKTDYSKKTDNDGSVTLEGDYFKLPSGYNEATSADQLYYATTPTNEGVKTFPASGNTIRTGSGVYNGSRVSFDLTDLKPETPYVAYFVLQGEAPESNSKVYLFRFETTKVNRPIISTFVSGDAVSVTTDVSSYLDYVLVMSSDLNRSPFNEQFNGSNVNSAWMTNDTYKSYVTLVTNESGTTYDYTILDAMGADVRDADGNYIGSVFDHYASSAAKEKVAQAISAQNEGYNLALSGDAVLFEAGKSQTLKSTKMQGTNYYTLLIMGTAKNGSEAAFRAAYPVRNTEAPPPMVVSCTFVDMGIDETSKEQIGELLVQFSKDLYVRVQKDGKQLIIPLDGCILGTTENKHLIDITDGYARVANYLETTPTDGVIYQGGTHETVVRSMKFKVELSSLTKTFTIILNGEICDVNGNAHENDPLNITVTKTTVDDVSTWTATVTKTWDAT